MFAGFMENVLCVGGFLSKPHVNSICHDLLAPVVSGVPGGYRAVKAELVPMPCTIVSGVYSADLYVVRDVQV